MLEGNLQENEGSEGGLTSFLLLNAAKEITRLGVDKIQPCSSVRINFGSG